jgi:hypothetical protein
MSDIQILALILGLSTVVLICVGYAFTVFYRWSKKDARVAKGFREEYGPDNPYVLPEDPKDR